MQAPQWLKPGCWGAVIGAVAIVFVGFAQLGWRTAGSSQSAAQNQADAAVVTALTPFCVAKAQQDTDVAKLTKFRAEGSSYTRRGLVSDAGWATLLGSTAPNYALAEACSERLLIAQAR